MSRLSIAALVLAFAALVLGVAGPAVDPAVLREQLSFADAATRPSEREPAEQQGERSLREEAGRWLARKIRERNERAEQERGDQAPEPPKPTEPEGLFGSLAEYVVPAVVLMALAGAGLAVVDWLRTRAVRPNFTVLVIAGAAIALPFAWSALTIAMSFAGVLIALAIVASILG